MSQKSDFLWVQSILPRLFLCTFADLWTQYYQLRQKTNWIDCAKSCVRIFIPICVFFYKVLCFHLGMTDSFIWDYKTPQQRMTKEEETYSLLQEIHHEFIKNNKVRQFSHQVPRAISLLPRTFVSEIMRIFSEKIFFSFLEFYHFSRFSIVKDNYHLHVRYTPQKLL